MRQAFIIDIPNQFGAMNLSSENPEENWTVFQKVVHSSAPTTIGHPSRKHQDLFVENGCFMVKNTACTRHIKMILSKNAAYSNSPKQAPGITRLLAEQESRRNSVFCRPEEMKKFHDALKTFFGPKVLVPPTT